MEPVRCVRIFLASPGDVADERHLVRAVARRVGLDPFIKGYATIDVVSWDDPQLPIPLSAGLPPQEAVNRDLVSPAACDATIAIFNRRMGTPIVPDRSQAITYQSGTHWELESAIRSKREVYIFRRISPAPDPGTEDWREYQRVSRFFDSFKQPDGSFTRSWRDYSDTKELEGYLDAYLRQLVNRLIADKSGRIAPSWETFAAFTKADRLRDAIDYVRTRAHVASSDHRADLDRLERRLAALEDDEHTAHTGPWVRQREEIRQKLEEIGRPLLRLRARGNTAGDPIEGELEGRARYLSKFSQHVQILLDQSIHHAVLLELCAKDTPAATALLPWAIKSLEGNEIFRSFDDAFARYDGRLLVLGSPGSGKTTTLLNLAARLAHEATADPDAPVPVLVNVSKFRPDDQRYWRLRRLLEGDVVRSERESFAEWLIAEVSAQFRERSSVIGPWVRAGRVAALLDGLDEIGHGRRAEFVTLLNDTYLIDHPVAAVVVCSRIAEYEPLQADQRTRLELSGAVTLQDLSSSQITEYLRAASAVGLQTALPRQEALQELARSPLTLSMMTLAYGRSSAAEISSVSGSSTSKTDGLHRLMKDFVSRMLERGERKRQKLDSVHAEPIDEARYRFHPHKTTAFLTWWAIQLSVRSQTACSLRTLYSFFNVPGVDGYGDTLARWSVRIGELGYVLALVTAAMALALRTQPRDIPFALAVTIASLAIVAVVSLLSASRHSRWAEAATTTLWLFAVVGGTSIISRLLQSRAPSLSLLPSVIVALSTFVAWFTIVRTTADRWRRLTLIYALTVFVAVVIVVVFGGRAVAFGFTLTAFSAMVLVVTIDWHTAPQEVDFWPRALGGCVLFSLLVAGASAWSGAAGAVGATEGFALLAVLLALLLAAAPGNVAPVAITGIAAMIGGLAGGVNDALASAAMCLLFSIALGGTVERSLARIWADQAEERTQWIGVAAERYFLSPLVLACVVGVRRCPVRPFAFFRYVSQALLLKPSDGEIEFYHRHVRDYFALLRLMPAFRSESGIRGSIIGALSLQGVSAIDPLAEIMAGGSPDERREAVVALGKMTAQEIGGCLERALRDEELSVRAAAVDGITRLGPASRLRLLCQAAGDRYLDVRLRVLAAAQSAGFHEREADRLVAAVVRGIVFNQELLITMLATLDGGYSRLVGRHLPRQLRPAVVFLLRNKSRTIRSNACDLMSDSPAVRDLKALGGVLTEDGDPEVRRRAALAMAWSVNTEAENWLMRGLRDPVGKVRLECARAFETVRCGSDALDALVETSRDPSPLVRKAAVRALAASAEPRAGAAAAALLKDRRRSVRCEAIRAVGVLRYRASVPTVVKALRSWHEPVRVAAIESLGWFGDADAPLLVRGLNDRAASVRRAAVEAVQRAGSREAAHHLRTIVSAEVEPSVREMMHATLAHLEGGGAT